MCGIVGILDQAGRVDPRQLEKMRDTMLHRGPDGCGLWVSQDGRVGFGHRRLSIVDLSDAGRQPMSNEDGSIWITYNGEIYNHEALRAELEAKGHVYHSRTDTETVIHAYEEWGADCLKRFDGMFAFALWDGDREKLFLARDRIGIKPLYFTRQQDRIIFASEIKAILADPGIHRDVSYSGMYHYLTFMTTPAPLTMFEGIYKLPAGCSLYIDQHGNWQPTRYWDSASHTACQPEDLDEAHAIRRVGELLRESIQKRMMSDVPFGVFLSGGLDSSLNVALMSEMMDQPVRTFTVSFKSHTQFNEDHFARQVAKSFGTDHHEVVIDDADAMGYLPQLIHEQDEPIADWVCIPLHFVSRLARDSGTTVVQVGEGSDEQFAGYRDYLRYLRGSYRRTWDLTKMMGPLGFVPGLGLRLLSSVVDWRFQQFEHISTRAYRDEEYFWGSAICFWNHLKEGILRPPGEQGAYPADVPFSESMFQCVDSQRIVTQYAGELASVPGDADLLQRMLHLELKLRLPELLLMRVDKIAMGMSLEARVPFLDHHLVEYTMGLPQAMKTRGGVSKYLLKRVCDGLLPDDIVHRRKMGFAAPVSDWMRGEFGRHVEDSFMSSAIHERDWFDRQRIGAMFRSHREGKRDYSLYLWVLFNLSSWYDHWIARR